MGRNVCWRTSSALFYYSTPVDQSPPVDEEHLHSLSSATHATMPQQAGAPGPPLGRPAPAATTPSPSSPCPVPSGALRVAAFKASEQCRLRVHTLMESWRDEGLNAPAITASHHSRCESVAVAEVAWQPNQEECMAAHAATRACTGTRPLRQPPHRLMWAGLAVMWLLASQGGAGCECHLDHLWVACPMQAPAYTASSTRAQQPGGAARAAGCTGGARHLPHDTAAGWQAAAQGAAWHGPELYFSPSVRLTWMAAASQCHLRPASGAPAETPAGARAAGGPTACGAAACQPVEMQL